MGKARGFSDNANDTVYQSETNSENYTLGQQNSYGLGGGVFNDQSGIGNFSQAGSDQRKASLKGALFLGNLGFNLQTVLLDVDTFTIDLNNDSAGVVLSVISTDRFVTLSTGTTADLVTITGAQRPGQRLRLYNTTINTITIMHTAAATVNTIRTPDGSDLVFPGNGVIDLTWDITSAQWRVVGNVGGSGGLTEPIILTINTITPETLPTTSIVDWSKNPNHIILDRDVEFSFDNLPASGSYEGVLVIIDIDGTGGYATPVWPGSLTNPPTIDTTANTRTSVMIYTIDGGTTVTHATSTSSTSSAGSQTPWIQSIDGAGFTLTDAGDITIKNIQTDGLEATLTLERNDTTPLDGDDIGNIFYDGPTDTAVTATWAAINVESLDVSNTSKQGELTISVQHDNVLAPILNYTGDDATLRVSTGIDVLRPNNNGSKELGTASFFWDDVFSETFTLRGSGGNTAGTARTVYADSAGMVFNMPSSAPVFTHSVENEIRSLLSNGELEIRTELSDGPTLRLRNNDQTPTGGSNGPKLFFNANDSALTEFTYGSIVVNTTSVLVGFKNATMEFRNMASNSLDPFMNFIGALDKINMFKFLDMNENYIEFDDRVVPDAPASTERILFSDSTNSAHLTIRTDTGTIDLEGAGSGANQQLSNLSGTTAVNLDLNLASNSVTFDGSVDLSGSTSGLRLDLVSNDSFRIFTNSIQSHFFSDFVNNIIRTSTGALGPVFQLTLDSSSPANDDILGTLVYGGRDSASNLQTYATIEGISADVTSASENGQLKFFVAGGTGALVEAFTLRSIASLPVIGFFGDSGTVRPTISGSRAGNAALADLLTSLNAMGLVTDSTSA